MQLYTGLGLSATVHSDLPRHRLDYFSGPPVPCIAPEPKVVGMHTAARW